MLNDILTALHRFNLIDLLDILVVAFLIYVFILLIKSTRAYPMALGIGFVGVLLLVTRWAKLNVSNWVLQNMASYLIIAIIVLFQGEIRRFLTGLGSRSFRKPLAMRSLQDKAEDLRMAVDYMSQRKIGALIAIENEISLANYADRGVKIDAVLSKDILVSLFFPHSPMHDGAVLLRGGTVVAAGCLLPLPAVHNLGADAQTRTRHLAAIGLSQETDAAVVVVSEETGGISLALRGVLQSVPDADALKDRLLEYLQR
ncbi:MAG: diadenylate cyclase CdaA [Acidobacteriota bacterium]|nr:diadenylate cyclase CdaA [Acidobacteriota bacterium]